jgi:hypothetical protein
LVAVFYYGPALVGGADYLPVFNDLSFEGYKLARSAELRGAWWKMAADPTVGAPYDPATAAHPGVFEGVDMMLLSSLTARVLPPRVNLHVWQAAVLCVNAWVVAWLVRRATGSALWASLGIVLVTFNVAVGFRMGGHLQLLRLGWYVLPVWAFHRLLEAPSWRTGAALGAASALLLQGSFYPAFLIAAALTPWWTALAAGGRLSGRHWAAAGVAAAVFLPSAAATVWPVLTVSAGNELSQAVFFLRNRDDLWGCGAELWQYVIPYESDLWRALLRASRKDSAAWWEGETPLGLTVLLAAAVYGVARIRGVELAPAAPRWLGRCYLAAALMIALSLSGGPSVLLYEAAPMFRCYGRTGLVALALLCVAAPITLHGLLSRLPQTPTGRRLRTAATAAVFAVALYEAASQRTFILTRPQPDPAWVAWLADQPAEVSLIAMPSLKPGLAPQSEWNWGGVYYGLIHRHRTMNGGDWLTLHRDLEWRGCTPLRLNAEGVDFLASRGYVAFAATAEYLLLNPSMAGHPALETVATLGDGWYILRIHPERLDRVAACLGEGFHPRQEDGTHHGKWCRSRGVLELENRTPSPRTVRVAMTIRAPTETRRVELRLGGTGITDAVDAGPGGVSYDRTLVLPPGTSRVVLTCEGTEAVVSVPRVGESGTEERPAAFGVWDLRLTELP